MAETTEAQMLQHLNVMIGVYTPMGADYNPPSPFAEVAHLQAQAVAGQAAIDALDEKETGETLERNSRQAVYAGAAARGSDVYQWCKAAGWAANDLADLQSHVRELRGGRSEPKPEDDPSTPDVDESKAVGSASQTSYASIEGTWSEMVSLLTHKAYNSTEDNLKLADLTATRDAMRDSNLAVAAAEGATRQERQAHDEVFYIGAGNIVQSANLSKTYVRAVHQDSEAWRAIKDFEFRLPKRLRS